MKPSASAKAWSVHVESEQPVERKIAVARSPVGAVDFPVEVEHQGQRVFGDRMRRIGRHAHDRDPVTGRRTQIDVVETGTTQCDELHALFGKDADGLRIGRIVNENAHDAGPLRQGHVVAVEVAAVVDDIQAEIPVCPVERIPVVGLRSKKNDFHLRICCKYNV